MAKKSEPKRCANFTPQEVIILLDIVKQHRHIVECKQSDRLLWNKKQQAWLKIADLFNAKSGAIQRDATVLKKKYENMKKVTKKRFADEKVVQGTGGGASVSSLITPIDEEVKELIEGEMGGCEPIYDSDIIKVLQVSDFCDMTITEGLNNGNESFVPGPNDTAGAESSNSAADSCATVADKGTDKWEHLAEAKLELVHLKQNLVLKEYHLKQKRMNEEHELMRESYKQKMQRDEEEHNLKMLKLKYELQLLKKQAT